MLSELKQRNVLRVAAAYLAVSWLLIQIVETIFPVFGLSDSSIRIVIILLAIGFPLAVIFSWTYEWTPEGVRLDKDVDHSSSSARSDDKKLDRAIIVVLALAVSYFAFDKFVLDPARDIELDQAASQRGRSEALVESYGNSSIAVLPFVNMSSDAEQEYFSDGLSEELLNLFSKIQRLRVISRTSSFSFKGKDIAIPSIAAQLEVAHVLVGSVRKAGNRVRVTARLIEGKSDTQLWSQSFDRELSDIFAIQDEISAAIVAELKDTLGVENAVAPQSVATSNTEAYEAFLRGRFLQHKRDPDSMSAAIVEFEKAVMLDPNYALAHAELALTQMLMQVNGQNPARDAEIQAQPHVERALELAPTLAEAHAAAGFLSIIRNGWGDDPTKHFEQAIQLNPNYSDAFHWLGINYDRAGEPRYQEIFAAVEAAVRLDPLSQRALGAYINNLVARDRLADADLALEKLANIDPALHAGQRGYRLSAGGFWADSILGYLDHLLLDPDSGRNRGVLRTYLAALGLDDEAMAVYDPASISTLLRLGRIEDALALAKARVAESPESQDEFEWLEYARIYSGLYDDAKPGYEDYWQEDPGDFTDLEFAMLIAMRTAAGQDSSDLIAAMKTNAERYYDAGMSRVGFTDYGYGLAIFLEGDHEQGIALIGKAVDAGFHIQENAAFLDVLYDDPDFAPILAVQEARQERERDRLLSVVCDDNPYALVWQPEEGTCEAFLAGSEK